MKAQTLYDKLWNAHVVRQEADGTALIYIDRHLVHEVTSPQAFEGLKLAGRKAVAHRFHPGGGRPQCADHRARAGYRRSGLAFAGGDAGQQLRRVRRERIQDVRSAPGHRACDRAGAGRDPAGHDGGVRRFAHQHARRVRRAGVRHRHVRGRARDGDAMFADKKIQSHAGGGRWRVGQGCHRQGHRAGGDRQDRHGGRYRLMRSSLPAARYAAFPWKGA